MNERERPETEARLAENLRAGDPAKDEPPLTAAERTAMRRRIVAQAGSGRKPRWMGWSGLLGSHTALAAALVVLAGWMLLPGLRPWSTSSAPTTAAPTTAPVHPAEPAERTPREIRFTTEAGTLVVWVLNPDFEPEP